MDRERNANVQVVSEALEEGVGLDVDRHVQITGSAPVPPRMTFPGDTQPGTIGSPSRQIDRYSLRPDDARMPATHFAPLLLQLARPGAGGAGF